MYERASFAASWGGCFATKDSSLVDTCGFKGLPTDTSVEIACFMFPDNEDRRIATTMGQSLVDIALASTFAVEWEVRVR